MGFFERADFERVLAHLPEGVAALTELHRAGKPVCDFRRAWVKVCVGVGLGREDKNAHGKVIRRVAFRMIHDTRRGAARNMGRAGGARGRHHGPVRLEDALPSSIATAS